MGALASEMSDDEERAWFDQKQKEDFLFACRTPGLWRLYADNHKRAADILYGLGFHANERETARFLSGQSSDGPLQGEALADFYYRDLLTQYTILAGYALECLTKGIILAKRPELIEGDESLSKLLRTHDPVVLCEMCNVAPSEEERELLAYIHKQLVWGKYPAPLKRVDYPTWNLDDPKRKMSGITNPYHNRRVQTLFDGIYARVLSTMPVSPNAGAVFRSTGTNDPPT